jgi:signal transduction histidine kinase
MTATTFTFSVDSALLRELGEKLVSTVHVALAELVKNAYDADATLVRVSITPSSDGGGPTIIIEDDGTGMTPKEVADFWMRIGTTNKESQPTSRLYGRPRTGKKGVGRFACRRLGRRLRLETTALEETEAGATHSVSTTVIFDWDNFIPGSKVESIPCNGVTEVLPEVRPAGTRLIISDAEIDEWQARGFDYLRRQLAVMAGNSGAQRQDFEEDPGFAVHLQVPGNDEQPSDLREQIMDAAWGTLEAEVLEDGCASFTLHASGIGGKRTYLTSPRFKPIFGAKLKVGILPMTKDGGGVRDPKLLANYVLAKLIEDWGGVQIRYNGFRMYPYGNPGDDWLKIDADRGRRQGRPTDTELFSFAASMQKLDPSRVLLNMLGMRNHLGHVDLPSSIPGIEPRLDRQGFIETGTFELLRSFVRMAIDWATIHREAYIRQRTSAEARQAIQELSPLLEADPKKLGAEITPRATQFLRNEINRLVTSLPAEEQDETRRSLLRTVKALEAISADSQSQLRHLRLVASASTLTLLFAHEVRSSISSLGAGSSRLRALAKKVPAHAEELNALSQQLGETQAQLARLVDMTGIVGAFRSDQRAVDVNLSTAIERAVSCFRLIVENYSIQIDTSGVKPAMLIGPIIEGEVYSILINLLSNAIKSLIASGKPQKLIRIWTEESGRQAFLRIADNGLGLDVKHFADVFTPFISDPTGLLYDQLEENANPEDAAAFGTGSGLGLSIARDIARARGGDIRFINPEDGWAACVEIEMP